MLSIFSGLSCAHLGCQVAMQMLCFRMKPPCSRVGRRRLVVIPGSSRSVHKAHLIVHNSYKATSRGIMLLVRRWPGSLLLAKLFRLAYCCWQITKHMSIWTHSIAATSSPTLNGHAQNSPARRAPQQALVGDCQVELGWGPQWAGLICAVRRGWSQNLYITGYNKSNRRIPRGACIPAWLMTTPSASPGFPLAARISLPKPSLLKSNP